MNRYIFDNIFNNVYDVSARRRRPYFLFRATNSTTLFRRAPVSRVISTVFVVKGNYDESQRSVLYKEKKIVIGWNDAAAATTAATAPRYSLVGVPKLVAVRFRFKCLKQTTSATTSNNRPMLYGNLGTYLIICGWDLRLWD